MANVTLTFRYHVFPLTRKIYAQCLNEPLSNVWYRVKGMSRMSLCGHHVVPQQLKRSSAWLARSTPQCTIISLP